MRKFLSLPILLVLSACGTLPQDGPSARAVAAGPRNDAQPSYAIIEMTYAVAETASRPAVLQAGALAAAPSANDFDRIAVGDTLSVAIMEPGGTLFGSGSSAAGDVPSTTNQGLPLLSVDRSGSVEVPFAGRVPVAGLTSAQAGLAIRAALRGVAVNPQVIVAIQESSASAVTVLGAITTPGRVPLKAGSVTVLDIIAAAGGPTTPPEDVMVMLTREGRTYSSPLATVLQAEQDNIVLSPGDRLNLVIQTRRYMTFGALSRVSQVDMPTGDVTLAAALAGAGGLNSEASDARSVLVFRFERPDVAQAFGVTTPPTARGVPVIYRLDLSDPAGLFTANAFKVHPEDVIYNPRAGSAELRKFFEFVQSVTRVIYDVTVTGTLNLD
jgi:polysaccharide export outer membrane protein